MSSGLPEYTVPRNGNGDVRHIVGDFGPRELVTMTKAATPQSRSSLGLGADLYQELGRSGLRHWGGFVFEEWLRELQQGRRAAEVYREMMDQDPIIGSIMYAITMLMRRVTWWCEPKGSQQAEWLWGVLTDMRTSWPDTITDTISFLGYGYCLPADQPVLTGNGCPVPIATVCVGDEVLTGRGRARRVAHVFTREYDGDLICIRARGYGNEIRLTPEHRVPTTDGWKKADDLTINDVLLRPRPELTEGGSYESGWIVGAYLAEGTRDEGRSRITFSVHEDEVEFLAARLNIWAEVHELEYALATHRVQHERPQATAKRPPSFVGHGGRVTFSHPKLRALIDKWVTGARAPEKRLVQLPTERAFAEGVVEGWAWGDGSEGIARGRPTKSAITTSEALAHQMQLLAGALGIPAPLFWRKGGAISRVRDGEHVVPASYVVGLVGPHTKRNKWTPELAERARSLAKAGLTQRVIAEELGVSQSMVGRWLRWGERGPKQHGLQVKIYDNTLGHPIRSLRRVAHRGTVYDLEVEEDHTFCAGALIVSNSYQETVYKKRNGESRDASLNSRYDDGQIGLAGLPGRSQDSLWKWVFDDTGQIEGMIQNPPPDYLLRFIPREKALHFRTTVFKDNPEGRSILRTAYRAWYFARNLQNIEGIGMERDLAGLPVLKPPPGTDIWDANDPAMASMRTLAQNVVSSIRRDEQEGIVLGDGWVLELLSTGGTRQLDIGGAIARYENRMATSVLADLVMMGQDKVGSYALAVTKKDLFAASLGAYLDIISSVVNTQLVPRLWALNGFTMPQPSLAHGAVETVDLDTLGNYIMRLGQSGAPIDWETVLPWAMNQGGLPEPQDGHDFSPRAVVRPGPDTPAADRLTAK